jgi:large repetitive protein
VHLYNSAGTYSIRLNASNAYSNGMTTQIESFSSSRLPDVDFSANVTAGTSSFAVQFTDTSSGNPTLWNWSFGDSQYSNQKNPVHVYTSTIARNYDVGLTVTNASGTNAIVKTSYIHIDPPPATTLPKASFTSNTTSGISPLTVQFNDTSTGNPTSWYWMFGDAKSSTEKNPVHKYTSTIPMNYYVSLTVTNGKGSNRIIKNDLIHVDPIPLPVASFTSNITSGKSPLTVQFTDASTGDPISWNWNFGDAKFSTEKNPVHTYKSTYAQNYTVTLSVSNVYGDNRERAIKTNYIHISPA